jgi:hypothetical protein
MKARRLFGASGQGGVAPGRHAADTDDGERRQAPDADAGEDDE